MRGAGATADVIVVGGGLAGSTLALRLGRQGLHVELYEQHHFPRDKPCAEGLMPSGVAVLDRLGVAGATTGARFFGIRHHGFGRTIEGRFPASGSTPAWGRAERRLRLDAALFAAASALPSVTAREGARVDGLVLQAGRVRGVTVDGHERRAALVVAADGPRSVLRRRLGLDRKPGRAPRIGVRRHYRLADGKTLPDMVEIFVGADHEVYVTPLPGREISIAALAHCDPVGQRQTLGGRDFFARVITAHAPLVALLEGAEAISEIGGRMPLVGGASRGCVPGFVLLGDAASALDPITGGGMAQALLSADLLANMLTGKRAGDSERLHASDDVIAEFDRQRGAIYREAKTLSALVLALVTRPRVARVAFGVMKRVPALHDHLIGVAAGSHGLADI